MIQHTLWIRVLNRQDIIRKTGKCNRDKDSQQNYYKGSKNNTMI